VIATMREWLVTVRALLAGETRWSEGRAITLHSVNLGSAPPRCRSRWVRSGRTCWRWRAGGGRGAELVHPRRVAASRAIVAQSRRLRAATRTSR
jgi:hypothetical protein